jgi:hypothetical protein
LPTISQLPEDWHDIGEVELTLAPSTSSGVHVDPPFVLVCTLSPGVSEKRASSSTIATQSLAVAQPTETGSANSESSPVLGAAAKVQLAPPSEVAR